MNCPSPHKSVKLMLRRNRTASPRTAVGQPLPSATGFSISSPCSKAHQKSGSFAPPAHMQAITIGIDLAKNVFQVHGVDANDKVVFNKPLRRSQVLPFFAKLAPCLIGMEACASAHYWARELKKLHDVRLMPAKDVKAYVKRNKNDSVDAAACSEAVRRPTVVPCR